MPKKSQVKIYLENSSLTMIDQLVQRRFMGSSRGEVMRNIIQSYLVNNAANIQAMTGMLDHAESDEETPEEAPDETP